MAAAVQAWGSMRRAPPAAQVRTTGDGTRVVSMVLERGTLSDSYGFDLARLGVFI